MIEMYKVMHGMDKRIDRETFFSLSQNTRTQGHPMKLAVGRFRTNKRKHFFIQRIVKIMELTTKGCSDGHQFGWL